MADVFDAEKRSDIMRQVKSKKNKSTELRLIEIFKQNGITGWRRNYPVKGHPDFVFPKKKIAVFVDGCFCMDTTAETLALPIIKNTGRRSANGTWNTTEK